MKRGSSSQSSNEAGRVYKVARSEQRYTLPISDEERQRHLENARHFGICRRMGFNSEEAYQICMHGRPRNTNEVITRLQGVLSQLLQSHFTHAQLARLLSENGQLNLEVLMNCYAALQGYGQSCELIIQTVINQSAAINAAPVYQSQVYTPNYQRPAPSLPIYHAYSTIAQGPSFSAAAMPPPQPRRPAPLTSSPAPRFNAPTTSSQPVQVTFQDPSDFSADNFFANELPIPAIPLPIAAETQGGALSDDVVKELKRNGISDSDYRSMKKNLMALGYSETEIHKVIFRRKVSKKIYKALIDVHAQLIQNYNRTEISNIAGFSQGNLNLRAVSRLHERLINLGFNKSQILQLASRYDGSGKLSALNEFTSVLSSLGFDHQGIIEMLIYGSDYKEKFELINLHQDLFRELKFNSIQIKKLLALDENKKGLGLISECQSLFKTFNMTPDEIIEWVLRNKTIDIPLKNAVDVNDLVQTTPPVIFTPLEVDTPYLDEKNDVWDEIDSPYSVLKF